MASGGDQPQKSKKCYQPLCDPSPAAIRDAFQKARLRAMDSRSPSHYLREWNYQAHLKALERVTPLVDTSCPLVPKGVMHKIFQGNRSGICHAKIEFDNARLLHGLASIYNGSWKTGLDNKLNRPPPIRNRHYERAARAWDIMQENIRKFRWIQNTKAVYSRVENFKWHEKLRKHKLRICKYPDFTKPPPCTPACRKMIREASREPKQYAFLLVEVEDKMAENIVIELYADLCPWTVKSFQKLCTTTRTSGCGCRTYRCKKIDRLHCIQLPQGEYRKIYWIVGGGVDPSSEYSPMMMKETSNIPHDEAGLVTRPKNRAGGIFFITVGPCPHLDEFCYVFGKVTEGGLSYLQQLENKNVEDDGHPILNMHITDCGVVDSPDKVPPPMLLKDFLVQVRNEIAPHIRKPEKKEVPKKKPKNVMAVHLKENNKNKSKAKRKADDEEDDSTVADDEATDMEDEGLLYAP